MNPKEEHPTSKARRYIEGDPDVGQEEALASVCDLEFDLRMPYEIKIEGLERLLRMAISGREPHCHGRPGFWDSFSMKNDYFRDQVTKGLCGPNGECFVCQARIQAKAILNP